MVADGYHAHRHGHDAVAFVNISVDIVWFLRNIVWRAIDPAHSGVNECLLARTGDQVEFSRIAQRERTRGVRKDRRRTTTQVAA
jgi:hypothetical protein